MKEIISNRRKLNLPMKCRLFRMALRENGFLWTMYLTTYYTASWIADRAYAHMNQVRRKYNLPGLHSTAMNCQIWQNWDWAEGGEEWTESAEWKNSLIKNILSKYITEGGCVLEVGSGAGRWTEPLQRVAGHLIAVDIADRCIDICKRKFAGCGNVEFFVNNGFELQFVDDESIDSVWSFDVFVHINAEEIEGYAEEFKRVMKKGSCGVIHHGHNGGLQGGWRSNLTSERFMEILKANGFRILEQIAEWRDGRDYFKISSYGDAITIFQKPY
jgi:ubiquinone/menaquinone biosynthesis C-methylase UbiE